MKLTICGSTAFWDQILAIKDELERIGHFVLLPPTKIKDKEGNIISVQEYYKIRKQVSDDNSWIWARKKEVILEHFEKIKSSDGILVVNHSKNNVVGYIGSNTLIDMGIALFLNKKIFLLNKIPEMSCKEEILAMQPIIINQDLSVISKDQLQYDINK